jgi:hypothetical protein
MKEASVLNRPSGPAVTRRSLFLALAREAQVLAGTLRGGQGFSLANLVRLPDEQLARLIPAVSPACTIVVGDDAVWAERAGSGEAVRLFSLEVENTAAFNLFNGENTLGDAATLLAEQLAWDRPRAFAHLRALFLSLARQMVCLPTNPLEPA